MNRILNIVHEKKWIEGMVLIIWCITLWLRQLLPFTMNTAMQVCQMVVLVVCVAFLVLAESSDRYWDRREEKWKFDEVPVYMIVFLAMVYVLMAVAMAGVSFGLAFDHNDIMIKALVALFALIIIKAPLERKYHFTSDAH